MPKIPKELTALEISRLTEKGRYSVARNLYLKVESPHSRSWVMIIVVGNKRRYIGLGSYPATSLAKAKERVREYRELVTQGIDPIEQKKEIQSALKARQAKEITFKECAINYIDTHSNAWKSKRTHQDWPRSLEAYAYPTIGKMLVKDVEQSHILTILNPIWTDKTETATRVRNRIEAVLDWAAASGYRERDNPARWKGRLDKLLPSPSKIAKVKHHTALPIDETPVFVKELVNNNSLSAQCLLFLILTATRSGEARGAMWSEIDFESKVWTIPTERMKAGKEHQIPLSDQAINLLHSLPRVINSLYVFPSTKGKPLSDMSLSMLMRRMNATAVPHGFRSTFRDWAGDKTNYPRDLAEAALAHTVSNQVEAAYRRGTALEKRREMMQDWGDFIYSQTNTKEASKIIKLKKA